MLPSNITSVDKSVDNVDKPVSLQPFKSPAPILALFAKQPVPGEVKTRLCPPLSEEEAARLCQVALAETVQGLWECPARMVLFYAGDPDWFKRGFPEMLRVPQSAGDLGVRLRAAAEQLFAAGSGPVILLGSDSPDLPESLVVEAITALNEVDVVTVPCADGGYALLGLRQPAPELFVDIPWSSDQVLSATRERAVRAGLVYRELEAWDDLDDIAALERLVERSPESGTARYVQGQLAHYLKR